jgi:nitronate monooxygenase
MAVDQYRQMILDSQSTDIIYSPYFTGVPGNYLTPSILNAGVDLAEVMAAKAGGDVKLSKETKPKAWKDIWSAGQGVGAIDEIVPVRTLVDQLIREFNEARAKLLKN